MLLLRSPLEDPLSAKRVISVKRRVQAFVILAIAFFVAAGFAANRYVTAAHPAPADRPVQDSAVIPSPEGKAVKPPTPSPSKPSRPSRTITHPASAAKVTRSRKPKPHTSTVIATGGGPTKNLSAEDLAVKLTNSERAKHGCSALRNDPHLRAAAYAHSKDMRVKKYFEHNSPDGKTPWDRIKAAGYSQPGAENIAMGYATAQAVLDGWMNSPGHRANILNCSLKAVGIGVEYGPGGPWWTQDFGFQ
ncbi:CAP domain-containing protein [Actinomadura sp. DC4]|uniref:CAP domain-containing protein n=1 Tax=Actinomadura sp. DC4 TaxID=3055069 RepID=UPI0025B11062|nr:CAP domain-containing protein [Actinomadura sp. DC4]MDN3357205.1 CAP domain-containing protein [Actinomadura sp. DC4]